MTKGEFKKAMVTIYKLNFIIVKFQLISKINLAFGFILDVNDQFVIHAWDQVKKTHLR